MQFQLLLLTALASLASSVPHRPWRFEPLEPATREFISGIEGRRQTIQEEMPHVPNCNNYDISNAQMSPLPSELPPPSVGLTPYHVTIGRGTQNYTCEAFNTNSSAVPLPAGAVATLFNISCYAALNQTMTNQLTQVAINNDIPKNEKLPLAPFGPTATLTGHHYFTDSTTATFNLDTDKDQLGIALSKKLNSAAAPKDPANPTSLNGPGLDGETYNATAVAWLKLMVESPLKYPTLVVGENRGGIAEVYRINTVGGNPPTDCSAFPEGANFTMPYSAEYWFWAL